MKSLIKNFENKRSWLNIEKDFTKQEQDILKAAILEIYSNNNLNTRGYNLFIVATKTDKYGIINRIHFIYFTENTRIELYNLYIGGLYGSDRIFEMIYKLVLGLGINKAVDVANDIYHKCKIL